MEQMERKLVIPFEEELAVLAEDSVNCDFADRFELCRSPAVGVSKGKSGI